jgi:hypothetical protein
MSIKKPGAKRRAEPLVKAGAIEIDIERIEM